MNFIQNHILPLTVKTVGGYFFAHFFKKSENLYICPEFFALKVEGCFEKIKKF